MIKANELRIGNYILADTMGLFQPHKIVSTDISDIANNKLPLGCEIKPIPITPEILEKCGFKRHDNSSGFWTHYILPNGWYISKSHHDEPSAGVQNDGYYCGDNYKEIKHLHQLQNLYFALTGKELDVKL